MQSSADPRVSNYLNNFYENRVYILPKSYVLLQVHAGETWAPEAQSTAHSLHQVHVHYGLSSLPASSEQQPVRYLYCDVTNCI